MTVTLAHCHPGPDQISLFALNLLEDAEVAVLQSHLKSCPECRRQAERVRQIVDILPHAAPVTTAPSRLKGQVLSRLKDQGRAWPHQVVLHSIAAVALLSFAMLGWHAHAVSGEGQAWADRLLQSERGTREGARLVSLQGVASSPAQADLYMTADRTILSVRGLAPATAGKVYGVWFSNGQEMRLVATLDPDAAGTVVLSLPSGGEAREVLISLEDGHVVRDVHGRRPEAAPRGPVLLRS